MNDNKPTCTIEDLTGSGAIIVPDTNIFDVYKGNMPLPPGGHYVIPNDVIVELEAYSRKFGMLKVLNWCTLRISLVSSGGATA